MHTKTKIGVAALFIFGTLSTFMYLNPTDMKNVPPVPPAACTQAYEALFQENIADLSSCITDIREDTLTESTVAPKQNNVVLVFDASGSMAGAIEGERKIDIAKNAVRDFMAQLENTNTHVSLVVYGHYGDNTDAKKQLSCTGIEEVYPLGTIDESRVTDALAQFSPTGWTPIEGALRKAYTILEPYASDTHNNTVLLISDGIETCGGAPAAFVQHMRTTNTFVTANVIGFDVTEPESIELRKIAESGGGDYLSVSTKAALRDALKTYNAYLDSFDYRINRVSENLEDINTATAQHFACVQELETERAQMMLDMYASNAIEDVCVATVDELYSKEYVTRKEMLEKAFTHMMDDWAENRSGNQ
jgi:phosphotransferase system IIB component